MLRRINGNFLFLSMLAVFIAAIAHVDRVYFKRNHSFSVHFLYTSLPNNPAWDLPPPTPEQDKILDVIEKQKFHYLAKGCHTYAFLSEDGQYVLKFHRYASHLRKFPWVNHPISYHFSKRRQKIKEHNLQRLYANMQSYKESYENLREETGLICLHINRTQSLRRTISIVDKTQAEYKIPLDEVTFILQYKADLVFQTLDKLLIEKKVDEAKKVISNIIHLIADSCQKGYVNVDPALHRNYGLLKDRAIYIDIGDLIRNQEVTNKETYIPQIKELTHALYSKLAKDSPELLAHYQQEIDLL